MNGNSRSCWCAIAILALAGSLASGCASIPPASSAPPSFALTDPSATELAQYLAAESSAHPGQSAFHVLVSGVDALAARARLIDAAQRTLDLQYYIVQEGLATDYLLSKVIAAADRGVRVRFLMDDSTAWGKDAGTAALSTHPNIEVRVFNSIGVGRRSSLRRAVAMMFGVSRLHRRMHNKMLVADNVAAVVGGRNLADEYFGAAPDVNFADLDLLIAGPVVQELSASFDEYWNSRWAVPVASVSLVKPSSAEVDRKRAQLATHLEERRKENPAYFGRVEQLSDRMSKLQPELPWVWATGHAVYDSPEKIGDTGALESVTHIGPRLLQQLDPVQSELVMISAYFIPGSGGAEKLGALARRGVSVRVITNGLASTDVTAVFAAYSAYRERLLRDGVQLYELRTDPGAKAKARELGLVFGSSAASLHTKAIVFDGRKAFVGSMNLDPRSQRWNTEVGVLVDSPEIAQQVLALARIAMKPENSYRVVLEPQDHGAARLNWIATENGREARRTSEPAGSWRRFNATVTDRLLPQELL